MVRQDGRDAVLSAGDFALYDSTRPYQLLFGDDFEQIVLKLPGDRLRSDLRETETLTATTVSGREGAGHLLIGMIRTLRDDIDTLQPASALAVANGVLNILVAGLQTLPAARSAGTDATSLPTTWRASSGCIDDAVGRPGVVGRAGIAAELGLSASHVHRLFKSEAGHAVAVHLEPQARSVQPRPARSAHGGPLGRRDRLRPRLQRRGAFQPRVSRSLRVFAARVAANGRMQARLTEGTRSARVLFDLERCFRPRW